MFHDNRNQQTTSDNNKDFSICDTAVFSLVKNWFSSVLLHHKEIFSIRIRRYFIFSEVNKEKEFKEVNYKVQNSWETEWRKEEMALKLEKFLQKFVCVKETLGKGEKFLKWKMFS